MKMADSPLERQVFTTSRVHLSLPSPQGVALLSFFCDGACINAISALRLPRREHAMEFVPNEISPLVDVYPFAMNVEGGGNAVSRTCSRDSRGEYPVLGRDERVFRGVVFVKLSKIDFLPMFSLIFRQRFKISNCSSELGRNNGNGNYSSDKSFCTFKNCRVEENSLEFL